MSYAINWNTAEQRIKTHKDFLLDTAQKMDEERLKFLLEAYEENKGESSFVLRAKLLEKVLLNKSIFLDENLIVGTISGSRAAVYPYPEWQVNWIKDELDAVKMSSLGEVKISEETKDILKRVYKQWKGKTTYDRSNKLYKDSYGDNPELLVRCGWIYPVNDNSTGSGVANYPLVLNLSLIHI